MPLPGEKIFPQAFRFPWRTGNHVAFICDGERFFPKMLTAIESAQHFVLLEFYLFESGNVAKQFIRALCAARARDVEVNLLVDGFGSLGLDRRDRRTLTNAGVTLKNYNPLRLRTPLRNLARDHRKLMIVDGHTAFVGGAGISDDFMSSSNPDRSWRELMLCIQGPVLADWLSLYRQTWTESGGEVGDWVYNGESTEPGCRARVTCTRRLLRQEIRNSLVREMKRAEHRIWLCTAYFLPSWTIRRAMRAAASRGVEVCLLLPGSRSDHPAVSIAGRRYYARLLRAGVRIFEYQPRFLHMKVMLVDDWISAGSCNMDHWTLRWDLEANQEIDSPILAAQICEILQADLADAREIQLSAWERRTLFSRILERISGWFDQLLTRLGQ